MQDVVIEGVSSTLLTKRLLHDELYLPNSFFKPEAEVTSSPAYAALVAKFRNRLISN